MKKKLSGLCAFLLVLALCAIPFKAHAQQIDIPKLYFRGNISHMYEKSDVRKIYFQYTGQDQIFTGFATIKIQGNSSLGFEKKNYTVTFYHDEAYTQKLKVDMGWGPQSKYCLKANWIDKTHARNVVAAKLAAQVQQKYNVLPDAPCNGLVDGFPVEIYINGEFLGLYTFNIPKGAWQFGMDSENPDHIVFGCEGWEPSALFWAEPDSKMWSVEVGEEGDATLDKLKKLYHFISDTTTEEFVADFDAHLDLDAALNYYILADFAYLRDNVGKNMLLATYDGEKWYPSLYDLDTSWGTYFTGKKCYDYENEDVIIFINQLFLRLENNFGQQLTDRYFQLRQELLTKEHIMAEFNAFKDLIPEKTFEREQARWGTEIPGYGYDQIESFLDDRIPKLDRKYGDWEAWIEGRNASIIEMVDGIAESELQEYLKK